MTVAFFRVDPLEICQRIVAVLKQGFVLRKLKPVGRIGERKPACQFESWTPAVRRALIDFQGDGFMQIIREEGTLVGHYPAKKLNSFIGSVVNAS